MRPEFKQSPILRPARPLLDQVIGVQRTNSYMPPRCRGHACQFMRLGIFLKESSAGARIDSVSNCSIGTHLMTDRSGFSEGTAKPTGVGTGLGSPVTKQIIIPLTKGKKSMTIAKKRVLIIDDEASFTRVLKLNLHDTGLLGSKAFISISNFRFVCRSFAYTGLHTGR